MKRLTNCDLCESNDPTVIFFEDGIEIIKCKDCGLVYSRSIPEIVFEREESPSKISEQTKIERRDIYLSILEKLKNNGSKLLDVGCRTGDFIILAKENGFDPLGVEISEKFASYAKARGLDVTCGRLKDIGLPDKSFDVITYLAVLEHISTPSDELREAYKILKDDGILILEIPNFTFNYIKAKISIILGKEPGLMPLNHIFNYTKETIHKMLEKNGFQIELLSAECSIEGREGTFLAKLYKALSSLLKNIFLLKWVFCNELIVFAKKVK